MMKKILKIAGGILLVCFAIAIAIPLLFEDKIVGLVTDLLNKRLDAEIAYSDADLSLLRNFPNTALSLEGFSLVNKKKPFENDTLAKAGNIELALPLSALFSTDNVTVNRIEISEAIVHIKIDSLGNANYDIVKEDSNSTAGSDQNATQGLNFSLEDYRISNSIIRYEDVGAKTLITLEDVTHTGTGDLSATSGSLDTFTEANTSFKLDKTEYLSRQPIKLDAVIGLDLEKSRYTFMENEALINQLPLAFEGYVQVNEDNQEVAISFETPNSDFKNFLAVIPASYTQNLNDVSTTGNFNVQGEIKGTIDDQHIPKLAISIASNDASFKYTDLPKSVQDIHLDIQLKNETGIADDTFLAVQKLQFQIDQDRFKAHGKVTHIIDNPTVNATIDGSINLSNLSQAYPVTLENKLQGTITTNLTTRFDMKALENEQYERISTQGKAQVNDFVYSSKDVINPIEISEASINFTPKQVTLQKFNATTGQSDIAATGTLRNLIGFLLSDKKLQGNIALSSNTFAVSDFMEEGEDSYQDEEATEKRSTESLKIPAFLDCTIRAKAATVLYDNLQLKNVQGTVRLKDQKATFSNVTSTLFDGQLALNGELDTQQLTPTLNMNLGIDSFDIAQSFQGMELLQTLAPIAKVVQGKLNTTLNLSGRLQKDYSLDLSSIAGDALAEVSATSVNTENAALLKTLGTELSFVDINKLDLKDLKTKLTFNDGKVAVKPFNLQYEDIAIEVSGAHGFDKTLDYGVTFQVPAKYLGKEAANLVSQLSDEEATQLTVPVTASVSGNFTSPTVNTDLRAAVSNLSQQIIDHQKKKLVKDGKDKLKDLLGDVLGGKEKDSVATDTAKTEKDLIKDTAEDILGNIFKKKKKKQDSIPNN